MDSLPLLDFHPLRLSMKLAAVLDGDADPRQFHTGQRLESDLGIYPCRIFDYYNARWYDPSIGRFTCTEPVEVSRRIR